MARTIDMTHLASGSERLNSAEIAQILKQPNGRELLLQLARMGRVDLEIAITEVERSMQPPMWKRVAIALLEALFSR